MLSTTPGPDNASGQPAESDVPSVISEPAAPRRTAAEVPWITAVGFTPGGRDAKLVNISGTGMLAECSERLTPGANVVVTFEGDVEPQTVQGHVARIEVAAMGRDGRLRYHVAVAFGERVQVERESPPAAEPAPQPPPQNRW